MTTINELTYTQLNKKHQDEVNAFPYGFAFNKEQLIKMKEDLPLSKGEKYIDLGMGSFVRESDYPALDKMMGRHKDEFDSAIANDTTGDGFIFQMFNYELANHEFGYTGDIEPTLDALGLTEKEILASTALSNGLRKASRKQK